MKTKPFLSALTLVVLCGALFFQCKQKINRKEEIKRFLTLFALQVQNRQMDGLKIHFDMPDRKKAVQQLINLLCEKTGSDKKSKAIFKVTLNVDDNDINAAGDSISIATFSLKFSRDTADIRDRFTKLTFRIKEVADRKFRIIDVDGKKFLEDYIVFENIVRDATLTDGDIYNPLTLAAFKTADSLKARYDSIPWFQHVGQQTYYFVTKGRFSESAVLDKDSADNYKMGLLDPQLKEIIPAEYNLIHNIGATYPNLIEVETIDKRGFYDLNGKNVLPVVYDQILPVMDDANLAVLRQGDNYFWWHKDYSVSEADPSIKIGNVLPRIQKFGKSMNLKENVEANILEANSREEHGSIYLSPSYMVDLKLMAWKQSFKNPFRRNINYYDVSTQYQMKFEGLEEQHSWLAAAFYSVRDYFLGGRAEFYDSKRMVLVNNKTNRVYGAEISVDYTEGEGSVLESVCNVNAIKPISDSLYEIRTAANLYVPLRNDDVVNAASMYHYFVLKNDKLEEMNTRRTFAFTKFIKMTDDYLTGCYELQNEGRRKTLSAEMLRYMKNEIYADYAYKFTDPKWREIFVNSMDSYYNQGEKRENINVNDSLTTIDKYNIAFIDQKLKAMGNKQTKVLAAK